jgi:hypothetical protein
MASQRRRGRPRTNAPTRDDVERADRDARAAVARNTKRKGPRLPAGNKPAPKSASREARDAAAEEFRQGGLSLSLVSQRERARDDLARHARVVIRAMLDLDGNDDAIGVFVEFCKRHNAWTKHLALESAALDKHFAEHAVFLRSIETLSPPEHDAALDRSSIETLSPSEHDAALDRSSLALQSAVVDALSTDARQRLYEQLRSFGVSAKDASAILRESPKAAAQRRRRMRR